MHGKDHSLPEDIAARARELGLSPQQELIVRLIVSERLSVKTVAEQLGTSTANIRNQITKIKRKAETAVKKHQVAALAQQARCKFQDEAGCVLYMHSRGVKNKDIAEALGIEKRRVADILYRSKGKRYVIAGTVPACEKEDSPAVETDRENAYRLYYRCFVKGNVSPNSSDGRDVLRGLALAGVGGWEAKKIVLSDRANMLRVLAERGRAEGSLLHVEPEDRRRLASVLERHFTQVGPHSWKAVTASAWSAVRDAAGLIGAEGRGQCGD